MATDLPSRDEQGYGGAPDIPPPVPGAPPTTPFDPPPIPVAPPTRPGELVLPQQRTVWPTPVGIVTIVLSAWTALIALGSVMMSMTGFFMSSAAAGSENEEMMQAWSDHGPMLIAAGVMLAIAAGLGIGGGIGLLMRKRWAVLVLFIFAGWKILAGAVHAVVQASWMSAMMEASMQASGQAGAGMPPIGMMSGAMKFVFGAILPVFILIWLSMPHIKKDYRGW